MRFLPKRSQLFLPTATRAEVVWFTPSVPPAFSPPCSRGKKSLCLKLFILVKGAGALLAAHQAFSFPCHRGADSFIVHKVVAFKRL